MTGLMRELAPISKAAWEAIDAEARDVLAVTLAGRKLVDFTGPLGLAAAAVNTGRRQPLSSGPHAGVRASLREAQPLVELRMPFEVSLDELEALDRGAKDPDLQPVKAAARAMAIAEDRAIFHGFTEGKIVGMAHSAAGAELTISERFQDYPKVVARALARLREAGVSGPFAIALGPRCYTGLTQTTTAGGFPVLEHVQRLLDGPVVWAPAVQGAVVLSQRGGDFELTVGRDLSVGYLGVEGRDLKLYLEESFTFRVLAPEAAVPLVYRSEEKQHLDDKLDEALDETFPASDPTGL